MNRAQMAFRCPDAEMLETVKIEGYRLAFRHSGVATLLPEPDGVVDGVLWRISQEDEKHLDFYEGYPRLYGKESLEVTDSNGQKITAMAYIMNSPYRESPAPPAPRYMEVIMDGCCQHEINPVPMLQEAKRLQKEYEARLSQLKTHKKKASRDDR